MSGSQDISVRIVENGNAAEIHIPARFDAANLSISLLRLVVADARVQITTDVEQCLAAIIDDYKANPRDLVAPFAHATLPIPGTSGAWTWEPDFDPAAAPAANAAKAQRTDHYASRILSVVTGTPIGRVKPPTDGTDGRSVTGAVLPARPGQAAAMRFGDGLQVRPNGTVVATRDGVIRVSKDTISVSPVLEIKGCVDFNTGKIDFKGDVVIADAVRNGFEVRATGNITINGPVEGATIACMGNLTCPRGVASAVRANIVVDGDSNVGYLRNMNGLFKGDLACRGELEHSDVMVGGELHCESGRIIGGRLQLTGTARIGMIGSPDWTPTIVHVGDLPLVASELGRLSADAARIQSAVAAKEESMRHVQASGGGMSAKAREQLTELQYELSELQREAAENEAIRVKLQEAMQQARKAELHVARLVYPRVRIIHAGSAFEFERELKGPLQFLLDARGGIQVRISTQTPRPITDFAGAVGMAPPAAAAVNQARKCA